MDAEKILATSTWNDRDTFYVTFSQVKILFFVDYYILLNITSENKVNNEQLRL